MADYNKYLNPSFSGDYCQATINAIENSFNATQGLIDYISNISLDNATSKDLDQLGLIVGYPRPVMPYGSTYITTYGYLDDSTYIYLLKMIAIMKYNGISLDTLDKVIYYVLVVLGGLQGYNIKWSSAGVSSPNCDIIVTLLGPINPQWIYLLETVTNIFLKQGVYINVVYNPFCFAVWDSDWVANPLGSGFSRLADTNASFSDGTNWDFSNGDNFEYTLNVDADKTHGGRMYPVI